MVTDGADPARRALVLAALGPVCGAGMVLPAVGWSACGRREVADCRCYRGGPHPSLWRQISHSVIQIVAVGAGSPVGKEVAPRELGALAAGRTSNLLERLGFVGADGARYWVFVSVVCWWRRVRRPVWRRCIRCRLVAWCTLWRRWLLV